MENGDARKNSFVNKTSETDRKVKTAISEPLEKTQLSSDFQQTLLKSGLDISAFQTETPEATNSTEAKSPVSFAVDFADDKNEFAKKDSIQSYPKPSENNKKSLPEHGWRWQHLMAIAGILTIIVLQSIFQFSFIQSDNFPIAEDLKIEQELKKITEVESPKIEISELKKEPEPKIEQQTPDMAISTQPKKVSPKFKRGLQITVSQVKYQKKEQRKSSSVRLRRAEKLLTGF